MKSLLSFQFHFFLVLFFVPPGQSQALEQEVKDTWCNSHREFVTTLEYMRKQDFYELGEQHSREIATQVAKGCNGSARRYVQVYELLKKVEAGARTTLSTATQLSQKTDKHVRTFMDVFKNAYGEAALDLDMNNSLKIAKALSVDYKGDPEKAKEDYDQLVRFCLSQKKIGGAIPLCAELATNIAKSGELFQHPVAEPFIETFEYLRSLKDLNLQVSKVIEIAQKVVRIHPEAARNYIASLKYSLSKDGLGLAVHPSLGFAMQMAQSTLPTPAAHTEESTRLPASPIKKSK